MISPIGDSSFQGAGAGAPFPMSGADPLAGEAACQSAGASLDPTAAGQPSSTNAAHCGMVGPSGVLGIQSTLMQTQITTLMSQATSRLEGGQDASAMLRLLLLLLVLQALQGEKSEGGRGASKQEISLQSWTSLSIEQHSQQVQFSRVAESYQQNQQCVQAPAPQGSPSLDVHG